GRGVPRSGRGQDSDHRTEGTRLGPRRLRPIRKGPPSCPPQSRRLLHLCRGEGCSRPAPTQGRRLLVDRRSASLGTKGGLRLPSRIHLERGDERFLRDVDLAELAHLLLAGLLLLEELALSGGVAAVALGGDVLAQRPDRLSRDDLAADRRL